MCPICPIPGKPIIPHIINTHNLSYRVIHFKVSQALVYFIQKLPNVAFYSSTIVTFKKEEIVTHRLKKIEEQLLDKGHD